MPARVNAIADTLPATSLADLKRAATRISESSRRGELGSAAAALTQRLRSRHGTAWMPSDVVRDIAKRGALAQVSPGGGFPHRQQQHHYQLAVFSVDHAMTPAAWTATALAAGFYRMELEVPARLRLLRWKSKHFAKRLGESLFPSFGRPKALVRKVLPLVALLTATAACSLVSKERSRESLALGPMPELSKPKKAVSPPEASNPKAPWHYVLPVDHGVRADASGKGHFRAPRFHGEHNGLDLLAPIGTPVFSPCEGSAMAGVSRSFGRWVHIICPVPDQYVKAGSPHPWASFFYAHLDTTDLPHDEWTSVQGSQTMGTIGKTGNAQGATVQPHLHLELIVQKNKRSAMDERHLGSDQSSVPAADHFADTLSSECMTPYGFEPKSQLLRRARRIDPFVALTCLSKKKPNFVKAPSPLTDSSLAWTAFYVAKDFNVNLGVEDSRVVRR